MFFINKSLYLVVISLTGLFAGWLVHERDANTPVIGADQETPGVLYRQEQDEEQEKQVEFPPRDAFVKGWPKPDVALFVSGNQYGYIEPCGCTGLENQKGGLMRRADCQQVLRELGWDMVSIDAGKQIRRVCVQANKKLQATYQTLTRVMKYDAIGFGVDELKMDGEELAQALLDNLDGSEIAYTSANVTILDEGFTSRYRVIERNGRRIGVTCVLGDEHFEEIRSDDITKSPVDEALARAVAAMKNERCDLMVLVGQTKKEKCIDLAKKFPVFDLIVTADGVGEPMMLPEQIAVGGGRVTQLIEVGSKGMYVGIVGCNWKDGKLEMRYERVPMDARFQDNPDARQVFVSYQDVLKQLYEHPKTFPDITPRKTPSGGAYIGSEACADCHDEDYEIWKEGIDGEGGPHARATLDLIDPRNNPRAEIKRNFDPECLSCHVTGWNPQKFFPYETGYMDLERDEALHGNGCENCHGPGKRHVEAENGDIDVSAEEIDALRKALYITTDQAKQNGTCLECHDVDNSPDFSKKGFDEYWQHIKHGDD